MLGENYSQLLKSFNVDLRQQAIDNLIDSELLQKAAENMGLAVSDDEVKKHLLTRIFKGAGGFSAETYRGILQASGMSAKQYDSQIKDDLARSTFTGLVRDAAFVNASDISAEYVHQETKYSFIAAEYDAKTLSAELPAPTDDELKRYYEKNAADYELPARVSYDYVVLEPKSFESAVNLTPQDVEMYYSDNVRKFSSPEQLRVRSIKLLYPKEADPTKLAAVREKANKAREEAISGKPFESLVTTYSDDIPSKAVGGERGWISRGTNGENFDALVFKTPVGGIAEVIESDSGFEVVKVEEKREPRQRPLDEVRAEIENTLRLQEAPAYAAAKAREISESSRKSGKPLSEIAQSSGLTTASTAGDLEQNIDPSPSLKDLTQKVMLLPTSERTLATVIDSGDTSVVVQIKEFKEPSLADFAAVKNRVSDAYKLEQAIKLAESKAQEMLAAVKNAPADLKKEVEARKASFKGPFEATRAAPAPSGFNALTPEMSKEIFAATAPNTVLSRYFKSGSQYLVAVVTDVKKPDLNAPNTKDALKKYSQQAEQQMQRDFYESTLALLKSQAKIDIDPAVLMAQ
jgi:peptidyl-prolyl cis-trans isomerase D